MIRIDQFDWRITHYGFEGCKASTGLELQFAGETIYTQHSCALSLHIKNITGMVEFVALYKARH